MREQAGGDRPLDTGGKGSELSVSGLHPPSSHPHLTSPPLLPPASAWTSQRQRAGEEACTETSGRWALDSRICKFAKDDRVGGGC